MTPSPTNTIPTTPSGRTGETRAWLLLPALLMATQVLGLIAFGEPAGSWANDQTNYHMVAIEKFAEELPTPDIVNYPSATSPGWHLLLAALMRLGAGESTLRLMAALAGTVLALAATVTASRWVSPRTAALLTLPLVLTPFAVGGSAWITTDVPALACVALALASVLRRCPPYARPGEAHSILAGAGSTGGGSTGSSAGGRSAGGGSAGGGSARAGSTTACSASAWHPWCAAAWATLGVAIRQPLVWLSVPIAWRAWRERRVSGLVAALLPVALLGVLMLVWKGLIPPAYRDLHQRGVNPAAFVLFLALAGAWGAPLALALFATEEARRRLIPLAIVGAVLALAVASAVPTSYAKGEGGIEGRWGGPFWSAVERTPTVADRSLLMSGMAALGGASLAVLAQQASRRGATAAGAIVLLALACVALSNAANSQAWERYADLPLLLLLPWLAALGVRTARAASAVGVAAIVVALMQIGIAAVNLWKPAFLAGSAATGALGSFGAFGASGTSLHSLAGVLP